MIVTKNFGTIETKEEILSLKLRYAYNFREGHPAVYCGTYGKYNNGSIDGMWVDITKFGSYDEFSEFLSKILHHDEEDPELMFQDYEYFPRAWYTESMMDEQTFDNIQKYAEGDTDAYDAYLEWYDTKDIDDFEEHYVGKYDSKEDFAEEFFESSNVDFPQHLMRYFDLKTYTYDLFEDCGAAFHYIDGYVFQD